MQNLKRLISIVQLLSTLGGGSFVFAQEATEAPAGDAVVVVAPVNEAPAPAVDTPAADGVQVNLVNVVIGLLTAFAAGGIVGIGGLSVFVQRLQKDTSTVTALELLQKSWPPETRELLLGISRGLADIGKLGAEVFDGVPVADKPVPPPEAS